MAERTAVPPTGWQSLLPGLLLGLSLALSALAQGDAGAAGTGPASLGEAIQALEHCGQGTDARRVAAALDVLRAASPGDRRTAELVSALLPYRHPLYRDRDKLGVIRLRAYLLATLADLEVPTPAPRALLDALIDTLVHADDETPTLELAAAARAAGRLGEEGRFFLRDLLHTVFLDTADETVSLERYTPDFPAGEATTPQLEALRALARLARPSDTEVVTALERLAAYRGDQRRRRLVGESGAALAAIRARVTASTATGVPR